MRTLDLQPHFAPAQHVLGLAYAQEGRFEESIAALEQARAASAGNAALLGALGHVFASAGRKDEARAVLNQLAEASQQQFVSAYWPAMIHAGLGETSAALAWLEKGCEQHDVWFVWLGTDPRLDGLRNEHRFTNLLRRMGLLPNAGTARA